MLRCVRALSISAALLAGVVIPTVQAQSADWPNRSLRMLAGANPGGGTDIMARTIADGLTKVLENTVVVENRPGVSNTLAVDATVKSTDGHTMVMGVVTAHAIAPHLLKLGYDNNRDLVPVAFVGSVPNVLVVSSELPVRSVADLVAMAKKAPGTVNFASSGTGSTQHIAAEMFKNAAEINIVHVPYKSSAPAQMDLISGRVQMSFDTLPSAIGQIQNGKLRALAVTSSTRNAQLPEVPTLAQAGVPNVEIGAWYGVYMPATTPVAVVQRLHAAVNQVLALPETHTRLQAVGAEIKPMSQAEFAAFHLAEYQRFGEVIRKNNISLD